MRTSPLLVWVGILAGLLSMPDRSLAEALPRPVGLLLSPDGRTCWIGQRQPAGIAVVQLDSGEVEQWSAPDTRLHDLTAWTDHAALALMGEPANLVSLDRTAERPRIARRWSGVDGASRVRVAADGRRVAVASLEARWVKCVAADALTSQDAPPWKQVELPFSPGEILWLPNQRHLLVADAFGDRIGLVDGPAGELLSVREIPGHNISGLTTSPLDTRVLLTHQSIHRGAQTSQDDIHWGGLLTNVARSLKLSDVLDPSADLLAHTRIVHLGDIGQGAGDPAGIAALADGLLVIALAGADEVVFGAEDGLNWKRVRVGARPQTVALSSNREQALVVNTLDDSLSLVPLAKPWEDVRTIPLAARSTPPTPAEKGERLFYSARLSHDGWFSCHSCHTDGHSNGQLVDNFTDGTEGTPKRVLSLRGVRETAPYGWDGRFATLAEQVRHSVASTMRGEELAESDVSDLVAFLETLPAWLSSNSRDEAVLRGELIFERENCARCHSPETLTTPAVYDVGLADERGRREFNPPSLRGVRHGGPYFHNGRATNLEEVVNKFQHQLPNLLPAAERADLVRFLMSL